jgi:ABC-type sugar transport system ATPase subunit
VSAPLVSMRGIVKQFPGVLAVDDVDFHIAPGEVVGLVGKNGAGKSTLIKILAGVERADAGQLEIRGEPVPAHYDTHAAHALGLAFMHQELANVPRMSVAENVALGSRYPRFLGVFVRWRRLRENVRAVLRDLDPRIDPRREVAELSNVQQRMVMVARALYHRAHVLVLDEPSASLTADEVEHLHDVVRRLKSNGQSVVYVSHRLQEIASITDRVVVMRNGAVVLERATAELDRAAMIRAIVGDDAGAAVLGQREARARRTPPRDDVLLSVRGLTRVGVVEDVDFDLHAGEILGVGGLIGSGRTELARMIAGADRPHAGTIAVQGRDVTIGSPRAGIRAGIALLPEDRRHEGLIVTQSVRTNITLASLPRHRVGRLPVPSRSAERRTARDLISRLDIRTRGPEQPVALLSGGNQQKVVLARWLDEPVDVLIFDEPTQGIDVHAKEEIFALIEGLAEQGKGVVLIASDFAELVALSDRVLVLHEGRVAGVLAADAITEQRIVQLSYGAVEAA